MGRSTTCGVCASCKVRSGIFGDSGVPGIGISGNPTIPDMVGWSGVFTAGGVVEIAASKGNCTPEVCGNEIAGISVMVNTGDLPVAGFPVASPLVILPGGSGGGTAQSDKLLRWAVAGFKNPATAINVKSRNGSQLLRPRIFIVFLSLYDDLIL
jgi:hypothetical protein